MQHLRKDRYKVFNWNEYNKSLKEIGNLELYGVADSFMSKFTV
jgi:hypothetical protein